MEENERKCRICLDGEDPALGRLIKPCKCDGSIRYVHVACLNTWRKASTSRLAFFQCPQCHYKYHFARTRVVGLATSHFVISFVTLNLFILLVFCASFIGSFILRYFDRSDMAYDSYSYWFYDPFTASRDLIASAIRILDEAAEDTIAPSRANTDWSRSTPYKIASPQAGIITRLVRRFILGLSVVGITSFVQLLWSTSLTGLMRYTSIRSRARRERERSTLFFVIIALVLVGTVRAVLKVYHYVEWKAKQWLLRAEYNILEVGD